MDFELVDEIIAEEEEKIKDSEAPPKNFSLVPKILNGGLAGIIGVTCVFPMDLVKTRLQNLENTLNNRIIHTFKEVYRKEGFFGMYRGASVNAVLVTPEKAIQLASNDLFRHLLSSNGHHLLLYKQMIAGGLAGLAQSVVTNPMELIKIQMQYAGKRFPGTKPSAMKIAFNLYKIKGILGFYQAANATITRDVIFSTVHFPLFFELNHLGPRKRDGSDRPTIGWSFLSGGIAGMFASFIVTPLDVIKTRLQTIGRVEKDGTRFYKGFLDAAATIYRHEGWSAFFKGGTCRILVTTPAFAITQTIYYLGVSENLLGYDRV